MILSSTMTKKLSLAITLMAASASAFAQSYDLPKNIQDGNILHCFNWTLTDIRNELPAIAEAGFGAVQISPIQGNANANAEWYYAYLPYDFAIRTGGIGNKASLTQLCTEADKYGIKIVVDVVANHVNGSSSYRATKWNDTKYWHSATFRSINYGDRNSITHDNLGDYPDMNSENTEVQQAVVAYINELAGCGVKGIRWDAAKHISLPSENCGFWSAVTANNLWHYGEILDSPGGSNAQALMKEYTDYISVTDNSYANAVRSQIRSGQAAISIGSLTQQGIAPNKLVYWAESHDTFANQGGETKQISQAVIDRTWALMACRQGATALYLSRPSNTGYNDIKIGVKGSTGFTAAHIAAVNRLRNVMGDTPEYISSADGVTCITRAGGGACIVVANGSSRAVNVPNGASYVPAGTYKDEVSGNVFTVTAGSISGTVGASGIAVIYDESVINAPRIDFEPGATSFSTPSLEVRATLVNATSGTITVNGGSPITVSSQETVLNIGADEPYGPIRVQWTAKSDTEMRSGYIEYTKIDPDARPADMPDEFYILGEVNTLTWDPAKGVAMTAAGSKFTADVKIKGYFSFAKKLGSAGDWNSFNASGNRYGFSSDATAALGQKVYFEQLNDPKAMSVTGITSTKTYTVTVDWNDKSVMVTEPSGVENIVADNDAPVEYFTLQGIPVSEPGSGLYIRRQGSQVSKVYIR